MATAQFALTCRDCGEGFTAGTTTAERCIECRDKHEKVRRSRKPAQVPCTVCGKPAQPYRTGQINVFCEECRDAVPSKDAVEGRTDRIETLLEAIRERKPIRYDPIRGLKADESGRAWIGHASDWHIGQQTLSEETGNLYYHDHEIALAQLEKKVRIERELIRDSGRTVGSYLGVYNGDLMEGDDMRASQHRQIEMLASEQAVKAYDLICYDIDAHLGMVDGEVVITMVGGNHDRLTRKPGNAGLGELGYTQTYAWMIGEFVRRAYANNPRVRVINWKTWYGHLMFNDLRVAHSHGADIKWTTGGHSGIPWNAIHVASQRYARMLGGYDLLLLGHGHINARLPLEPGSWVCLNGSLPGTTAWVQSSFKSVRVPIQQLLEVNRHGMVAEYPLYLDVGQATDAAAIWEGEAT